MTASPTGQVASPERTDPTDRTALLERPPASDAAPGRAEPAASRGRGRLLVAAVLALGVALRLFAIDGKRVLQPDEGVSYLAATGHEQAWGRAMAGGLAGHWTTAAAWMSYLRPHGFWGFTRIRVGLNVADNHPPLYFWALHLWVWRLGVHLWSGPLLNTAIVVGTGLLLYVLARRVLSNDSAAALVVALWIVSHPVVTVTLWARQYELLALCGVLVALALVRLVESSRRPGPSDVVLLAAAVAAALLTQYEASLFVLVAVAGTALVLAVARRASRLPHLLVGAALGVATFVALDPGFLRSFTRQRAQASPLFAAAILARLGNVVSSLESFYVWYRQPPLNGTTQAYQRGRYEALAIVVALIAAVSLVAALPRLRRGLVAWSRRRSTGDWVLLVVGAGAAAATLGGYLALEVPAYAMGTRYLALLWPFLALATVCALRLLPRPALLTALVVALVVVPMTAMGFATARSERPPATVAPGLVVDDCTRLVLPRLLWPLPGDTPVFAARPSALVQRPDAWLAGLRPGDVVITGYGGDVARSDRLAALLEARYRTTPAPGLTALRGYRVVARRD